MFTPDLDNFSRRLRLAYVYKNEQSTQHPFHLPSAYTPGSTNSKVLESYLDRLYQTLPEIANMPLESTTCPRPEERPYKPTFAPGICFQCGEGGGGG